VLAKWAWGEESGGLAVYYEIRLSDSGDVININISRPSGNPAYDESVRKAIQMASPLMRNDPPDATFFQRYFADGVNIEFKF
jgi:colicin import membrane protein